MPWVRFPRGVFFSVFLFAFGILLPLLLRRAEEVSALGGEGRRGVPHRL